MLDNEQIESPTPGGDATPAGTEETTPQQPAPAAGPTEFEIGGQKYTPDQIQQALKAAQDYQNFVPEFTRKSQLISKLVKEGVIDENGNPKNLNTPSGDPQVEQARKILKEQLGVVTKDDLEKVLDERFQQITSSQEAQAQLREVTDTLSKKYDGAKGEPKFDLVAIQRAAKENPASLVYVQGENGEFLVDLEQTYIKLNGEFYSKIPDLARKAPKTERGAQIQTTAPANKKEPTSTEDRVADAANFFRAHKQEE